MPGLRCFYIRARDIRRRPRYILAFSGSQKAMVGSGRCFGARADSRIMGVVLAVAVPFDCKDLRGMAVHANAGNQRLVETLQRAFDPLPIAQA